MRLRFPAGRNDLEARPSGRAFACGLLALATVFATAGTANAAETGASRVYDCVIDPFRTVKLGSPITGVLSDVLVARGDRVEKGQAIARLDSAVEAATVKLNRFRAESNARIEAQQARLTLARARLARAAELVTKNIVTQDKFEELTSDVSVAEQDLLRERQDREQAALDLERSQVLLDQRTIRSPFSGIVSEEHLSAGEFVPQEGYIMRLAQLDPLNVEVFLPVTLFNDVQVGAVGTVRPNPPIGGEYQATVTVVDRVFDAASGTFGVRLALPNPGNALPGGQRCTVSFAGAPREQARPGK